MMGKSIFRKTAEVLDIPTDTEGGEIHIELAGQREVFVENHKGILLLSETEVEISLGKDTLSVAGEGLSVLAMNACEVRIKGKITGIAFDAR